MYHVQLLDNLDVHHKLGFERISRSLLILGEPGFGKTVTLLELTRSLLELTGEDDMQPVPRVLSLSYWSNLPTKSEDWVAHEFVSKCQAPNASTTAG